MGEVTFRKVLSKYWSNFKTFIFSEGKSLSGYDDDIADVNQGKIGNLERYEPTSHFQSEQIILEKKKSGLSDFKQILPTCLILIVTLLITVTVIPYAFSSVIK